MPDLSKRRQRQLKNEGYDLCLLYTSDAADEL